MRLFYGVIPQHIFSQSKNVSSKVLTIDFENKLSNTLDALKQDVVSDNLSEYKVLFNLRKDSDLK